MPFPTIQGYEIIRRLGEGGMGTVYLARQISLNRPVAIKVLPAHLTDNPAYVMRFRQEAKAAARLKHINLVQIYDAGADNGLFYFVMEYIAGETVGQRLHRKGRLDEESTLLIGEAVAVALEYAWEAAQLVHRDIKPDNLLIDGDGTVKVADLGLAKIVGSGANAITMTRMMIGTPYYCSPEQAQGASEVDCRSDIYALGATMYHLATGYAPFEDTSGIAAMIRNVSDFVPDPLQRNPNLSENFAWLLETMMAKSPNCRQQSWAEVLADIDCVMRHALPLTPPPPPGESTVQRGARQLPPRLRPAAAALPRVSAAATVPATSKFFRIFLGIAAIFTVLLWAAWLKIYFFSDQPAASRAAVSSRR